MIILATRKGETVEIHYNSFGQLRNIVRHCRKWRVLLSRVQ
jgi:fumarylacetoacetate (FAA) hydrolase family protein